MSTVGGYDPLFFDTFSGGLGGFSFRKLRGGYNGRWGRVINTNTLVERNIGFVLDSGFLVADSADIFDLSGGTDTVELMSYDNSFVSIYFTPDPTTDRRPILVNSGTAVTLGGKPAADFPAIRRISMSTSSVGQVDPNPVTIISLGKIDTLRQRNFSVGTASGDFGYFHGGTLTDYDGIGVRDTSSNIRSLADEDTNRRLGIYIWDGTTIKISSNGGSLTSYTGLSGSFAVRNIGCAQIASLQSFSGKIQEVLLFSTNKESEITDIFNDIDNFYTI